MVRKCQLCYVLQESSNFQPFEVNRLETSNDNSHKTSLISNIPFLAQKQHPIFRMLVQLKLSNHFDPKMNTVSKQTRLQKSFLHLETVVLYIS